MMISPSTKALAFLLFTTPLISSLQVTPDSPCSSFCLDAPDLDPTDPESSNTYDKDIVCQDSQFQSDKAGKKYQSCMTCLQQSEYSKGEESDLDWFLYNLRYSFDFCTFGTLDSNETASNPCVTSGGCGSLTDALRHNMVNTSASERTQYGYCEADDGALASEDFDRCLSCVSAEASSSYLSNFLIALSIGCQQRPLPGTVLGLNETVFTKNTISAIDPSKVGTDDNGNGLLIPTTAIVGVAIGGFVLLLLASGCIYMQHRKRKNRQRVSGWSFRCKTPSGTFPTHTEEGMCEKPNFHSKMGRDTWGSPYETKITGLFPDPPSSTMNTPFEKQGSFTRTIIAQPPPLQTSGRGFHNPNPFEDYASPSSATSTRSNNPLLQTHSDNVSPMSHSAKPWSGGQGQTFGDKMGFSRGASPQTPQSAASSMWDQKSAVAGRALTVKVGMPQVARQVDVRGSNVFPPPPQR